MTIPKLVNVLLRRILDVFTFSFVMVMTLIFFSLIQVNFGSENAISNLGEPPSEVNNESSDIKDNVLVSPIIEAPETADTFDRQNILQDKNNLVSADFKIPEGLEERVGFWFDVYSKYDSNHRLIHHARYPWVVFKVVDVTSIINAPTPKVKWLRNLRAEQVVKQEEREVRQALKHLATGSGVPQNATEVIVAEALKPLGGILRVQAAKALHDVRMQQGQKDFFSSGLQTSQQYMTRMEEIMRENKLPVELARLPFVESSFNHHAVSKVGAVGIWQFTSATGRNYMHVDGPIDERKSPLKATVGAARLLKENHMILSHSWPLAVTAWNHGPGGVRKAIRFADSQDLAVIVRKYRSASFDFASSNFYSEFLAALYTERYAKEIFGAIQKSPEIAVYSMKFPRNVRVKEFVKSTGLSIEEFIAYNPDLAKAVKDNLRLPAGFQIQLPETARSCMEGLSAEHLDPNSPAA